MKWLFYSFILLLLLTASVRAYDFQLVCRTDTHQLVQPYGLGYFTFTLTNTGSEPDIYELNCIVLQTVPDWSIIYCLQGRCLEPGSPMFDSLAPGHSDTTIEIKVYTSATPGEAIAVLVVRSLGDTSLRRSITTITNLCGAVDEETFSPAPAPTRNPLLKKECTRMLIHQLPAVLLDVTGRQLLNLTPRENSLSPLRSGIYFLKQPGTVRKLILF
ncbi:MAG: hypothetical protein ACP5PK_03825 [candidate division WOR-3 bacterium]